MSDNNFEDNAATGGVPANENNPVPAMPDHAEAHSILSEIQDELHEGKVLTAEFVAWCKAKFTEAKSHL